MAFWTLLCGYLYDVLDPSKATLWDVICPFYHSADIKKTTEISKETFNTLRTLPQWPTAWARTPCRTYSLWWPGQFNTLTKYQTHHPYKQKPRGQKNVPSSIKSLATCCHLDIVKGWRKHGTQKLFSRENTNRTFLIRHVCTDWSIKDEEKKRQIKK